MQILPETEIVRIDEINAAFERMECRDVRCRLNIDMGTLALRTDYIRLQGRMPFKRS